MLIYAPEGGGKSEVWYSDEEGGKGGEGKRETHTPYLCFDGQVANKYCSDVSFLVSFGRPCNMRLLAIVIRRPLSQSTFSHCV